MTINSDDLARLELAAVQANPIDLSGVEITAESGEAYNEILQQVVDAPVGVMASIPFEWAEAGKYDDFMKKEYAKYGAPRSLEELTAAGITGKPTAPEATSSIVPNNGEPPVAI